MPASSTDPRVVRVVTLFETLRPDDVARLGDIYSDQVRFKDPFHDVQGLAAVQAVFGHMFQTLDEPRFVVREAIVQGDAKVQAISAASILAKVARDLFCEQMHETHPQWGFAAHKGYSTPEHLAALKQHGASPWHRRSFAPVREVCLDVTINPLA